MKANHYWCDVAIFFDTRYDPCCSMLDALQLVYGILWSPTNEELLQQSKRDVVNACTSFPVSDCEKYFLILLRR